MAVARPIGPDADDDITRDDADECLDVTYEYLHDTLELEAEHRGAGITLTFRLRQEAWTQTTGDLGVSIADETVSFRGETTVTLPNGQKDAVVTDELPDGELEFEVTVYVTDDGADTDIDDTVDD